MTILLSPALIPLPVPPSLSACPPAGHQALHKDLLSPHPPLPSPCRSLYTAAAPAPHLSPTQAIPAHPPSVALDPLPRLRFPSLPPAGVPAAHRAQHILQKDRCSLRSRTLSLPSHAPFSTPPCPRSWHSCCSSAPTPSSSSGQCAVTLTAGWPGASAGEESLTGHLCGCIYA